jgi:YVTN family beta-propeller protein
MVPVVVVVLASVLAACGAGARTTPSSAAPSTAPRAPASPTAVALPGANRAQKSADVYAAAGANMFSPAVRGARTLVYVPESMSDYVDVIDPATFKVIDRYRTGGRPQHVVPAWDLRTLYATNNLGNSLTPINPDTGTIAGRSIPVEDPYNLYFTPDGRYAVVVAERLQRLDFRDRRTFALVTSVHVDCAGVDHIDFSADGTYLIATCEFAGRLVKVNAKTRQVIGYLDIPGASPQDIKLEPAGRVFYVADMHRGGVYEVDGASFRVVGFTTTGPDAHGLYPSRDGRSLYVSNRRGASVSVIDFATRAVVANWPLPGTSPDMGGVSADGKVLWRSGRFHDAVYAISTTDGRLLASIHVPHSPHGLCLWPQPGRYSVGHTGILR